MAQKHQDEIKGVVLFYPAYYMADYAATVLEKGPTKSASELRNDFATSENGSLYDWDNLLVSEKFNSSEDKTLIKGLCNNEVVMSLTKTYNEAQLKFLSNGYDTQLKRYEKY